MRALERGELGPDDAALVQHLDACLGCLGCEPVCPSGVGYGRASRPPASSSSPRRRLPPLAAAGARRVPPRAALAPAVHARPALPRHRAARGCSPAADGSGSGWGCWRRQRTERTERTESDWESDRPLRPLRPLRVPPTVALFRGCVMDTLFRHVHDATRRTLEANGYAVVEVAGQVCCGALHEHAGDRAGAEALARRNVAALADAADYVVVNSAGCGALLKGYGHLLGTERPPRFGGQGARRLRAAGRGGAAAGRRAAARRGVRRPLPPAARPAGPGRAAGGAGRDPRAPAPAAPQLGQVLRQRGDLLGRPAGDGARGAGPQDRELRRRAAACPRSWPPAIPGA